MADFWERIESENDPQRCQTASAKSQCTFKAVPGTKFCPRHTFNNVELEKQRALCNYRLKRWNDRVIELTHSDGLKSLRDEIGISRMVLEEIVNKCADVNDLIIYSDKINNIIGTVERLIISCQKLEERNNLLLDKSAIVQIADNMIKILSEHIVDSDLLATLGDMFYESITRAVSPKIEVGANSSLYNNRI